MTDGAHVDMRLCPHKLLFGHGSYLLKINPPV
jgi:hypothetical protein